MQMHNEAAVRSREPKRAEPERVLAAVDVYENDDEILIVSDFPGVTSDALSVHLEGTELTLEGKRTSGATLHRSFEVPSTIDPASVEAKLNAGVLTLRLPKRAEAKPRRIEVKVG
jgi:HSP20 family molecular chaperone IbpA